MNMLIPVLAVLAAAFLAAFLWAYMGWQRARAALTAAEQKTEAVEEARAAMHDYLRAQAAESARAVADQMVTRASDSFRAQEQLAAQRMEAQLKPVAETLSKFQEQVAALEKARAQETGGLKEQLTQLMAASSATRDEARRLTEALKGNSGRRGRWGEQTCRNVLEAAGMAGRFDFQEQTSQADDEGRHSRPDFIVRLPGGGMFVIDAKTPLAFADETDGDEEAQRLAIAARNAASIKTHMRQLSAKAYQDQFQPSPDFVAMFIPGDGFLGSALDREPDLMTEAMAKRVLIVTPTTLFALCKAVAYGWRAEEQSANADQVARLGKELYRRLATMGGYAASLGQDLDRAVKRYNQFVGSLESQVMVQAKRFEELHVDHEGKTLPDLTPVEQTARGLSRPELIRAAADEAAD